ncbi:DoxX family protein [Rhodocytophaga rosea]|uniref:DoxX family protein n=1 Tax=Rhodocytophaga rosea TaxID=2704465 RepID=A0A6C0GNV3_9BACT|nr:DoxX family protein [Rhodocytophaga rosea]QHT69272.1 DoxX family protein [Rhodocytophaga rosea]
MKSYATHAQLYLRLALGIGFLNAVLDRFGWLGAPGENNVAWGNWNNFLDYTYVLLPFLSRPLSDIMGWMATIAEVLFGVLLMVGYQTRLMALGSFVLTLLFALSMALTLGIRAPLNYSVFAVSAGSLLLAAFPAYSYSIDSLLTAKKSKIFS